MTEEVIKHEQAQNLYIVYEGDYNYLPQTVQKSVTFNAIAPAQPVITAQPGDGLVTISWQSQMKMDPPSQIMNCPSPRTARLFRVRLSRSIPL